MSTRSIDQVATGLLQSYLDRLLVEVPAGEATPVTADPEPIATPGRAPEGDSTLGTGVCQAWRKAPFQALFFRVREVGFAAPLLRLHGVVPWKRAPSELPNTPDWFLGVATCRNQTVGVVDTAGLILPGQNLDVYARPQHIILLGRRPWGLTCDAVSDVLTVTPDAVQWRTRKGHRPWLAGTLRDRLCALLDVDALVGMLEQRENCECKSVS